MLIFQIRTNAASINKHVQGGQGQGQGHKVGCALSAYMGYTNHSCAPSLRASVDGDGFLCLRALSDVAGGEEGCISYIDESQPSVRIRRKMLLEQYQFVCQCKRCVAEDGGGGAKAKGNNKKKKGKKKKK